MVSNTRKGFRKGKRQPIIIPARFEPIPKIHQCIVPNHFYQILERERLRNAATDIKPSQELAPGEASPVTRVEPDSFENNVSPAPQSVAIPEKPSKTTRRGYRKVRRAIMVFGLISALLLFGIHWLSVLAVLLLIAFSLFFKRLIFSSGLPNRFGWREYRKSRFSHRMTRTLKFRFYQKDHIQKRKNYFSSVPFTVGFSQPVLIRINFSRFGRATGSYIHIAPSPPPRAPKNYVLTRRCEGNEEKNTGERFVDMKLSLLEGHQTLMNPVLWEKENRAGISYPACRIASFARDKQEKTFIEITPRLPNDQACRPSATLKRAIPCPDSLAICRWKGETVFHAQSRGIHWKASCLREFSGLSRNRFVAFGISNSRPKQTLTGFVKFPFPIKTFVTYEKSGYVPSGRGPCLVLAVRRKSLKKMIEAGGILPSASVLKSKFEVKS